MIKQKFALVAMLPLAFALASSAAMATSVTNADILKMSAASLSADLMIASIRGNPDHNFDTGTDALIALKTAKVPDAVIAEMFTKVGASPAAALVTAGPAPSGRLDMIAPNALIAVDGGVEVPLAYTSAEVRTAVRALGFGGAAIYNVLRGPAAAYRMKNSTPNFLVSIPTNAQLAGFLQIASFAVRRNGNREVMVGGGVYSMTMGIHEDRVIAFTSEKLADQGRAPAGYTAYKVTIAKPLAAGEYAVVLTPAQPEQKGLSMLGPMGLSCYDFGVN